MKTSFFIFPTFKFFRRTLAVLTIGIVLIGSYNAYGQKQTATNDILSCINKMKEKTEQAYIYAEQASNAVNIKEANTAGKQIIVILEEAKNISKNAQTALDVLSTPENKYKCGKRINSVANDIFDLQNKIEWATHEANKIAKGNELDELKYSSAEVMADTKKMSAVIAETTTSMTLIDQELNAID